MCGRYAQTTAPDELKKSIPLRFDPDLFTPRYNIAPTQIAAVLIFDGEPVLRPMHWGLPSPGLTSKLLINARAETLFEKPSFRHLARTQRCLVLADGFYEWKKDSGKPAPVFYQLNTGGPFCFAGIWNNSPPAPSTAAASFAIITTSANSLVQQVHTRMPAILRFPDALAWIDPRSADVENLKKLLQPFPARSMISHPVSPEMNSPQRDNPSCIAPWEQRPTEPNPQSEFQF